MKKCETCIWADKRSGTKIFCPFPSCVMKNDIRNNLIKAMEQRMDVLRGQIERQFGGDIGPRVHEFRELKYWKEAIERGEFD